MPGKAIFAMPAVAVLALTAVAACSSSSSSTGSSSASSSSPAAAGSAAAKTSGTSGASIEMINAGDPSTNQYLTCGAQSVAQPAGIHLTVDNLDTFDPTTEIPVFDAAIARHPAVIVFDPADPKALLVPVRQAEAAGIKIVTLTTELDPANTAQSVIAPDYFAEGEEAADQLAREVGGRSGPVGLLGYQPGVAAPSNERQAGFEQEIKKYPNLQYIGPTLVNFTTTDATAKTDAIIAAHPNLVGIFATFSLATIGMDTAVEQEHLAGKLATVGADPEPVTVAALKSGILGAFVALSADIQATEALQQAVKLVRGQAPQASVVTPAAMFTKANIDDPSLTKYYFETSC
jgi:ribose transport system substrate-binding protein